MIGKLAVLAVLLTAVQGSVVPNSRQGNANTYVLYTPGHDSGRNPYPLPAASGLVANPPPLDDRLDTIVVVHGHGEDKESEINIVLRREFFATSRTENVNLIIVDWSTYTKQSYNLASGAVASVGRALGEYLQSLANLPAAEGKRIVLEKLHLIGFDLGAHVVGFAGRSLGGLAARITGLDPAGSGWSSSSNPRLSSSDAKYVEVIHTDGSGIGANGIGTAIGHVDFFINGGSNQPGCLTRFCSHIRAYLVFAATLNRETPIYGFLCNSNLQLTLNKCTTSRLNVGGEELWKIHGTNNVYRANTGRSWPY